MPWYNIQITQTALPMYVNCKEKIQIKKTAKSLFNVVLRSFLFLNEAKEKEKKRTSHVSHSQLLMIVCIYSAYSSKSPFHAHNCFSSSKYLSCCVWVNLFTQSRYSSVKSNEFLQMIDDFFNFASKKKQNARKKRPREGVEKIWSKWGKFRVLLMIIKNTLTHIHTNNQRWIKCLKVKAMG